jgi:hypothetical protein
MAWKRENCITGMLYDLHSRTESILSYLYLFVFKFLMAFRYGGMKVNSKDTETWIVSRKASGIVKWIIHSFTVQEICLTFCDCFHRLDPTV